MKNLFFVFLLAFGLMSFTPAEEVETNTDFTSSTQVENLVNEDFPCRWRTCTYVNGVLVGCTPWTYGDCKITIEITIE